MTTQDEEDKAFLAEMSGEETEEIVDPEGDADESVDDESSEGGDPESDEKQEPTLEEKLAALEERNQKLQRALDTTNGRYGSELQNLKRQISQLTQPRQQEKPKEKEELTIKPEDLESLREDYPELAEKQAQDLTKILRKVTAGNGDKSDFEAKIMQMLDEERQARVQEQQQSRTQAIEREIRELKEQHPDFQEVAGFQTDQTGLIKWNDMRFGNWVATQPEEVQNEIINGQDARTLSSYITSYKNSANKQQKTNNLKKAIQPKGVPGTRSPTEMDPEEEAFREEMKRA